MTIALDIGIIFVIIMLIQFVCDKTDINTSMIWFGLKPKTRVVGSIFSLLFGMVLGGLAKSFAALMISVIPIILTAPSMMFIIFVLLVASTMTMFLYIISMIWILEFLDILIWRENDSPCDEDSE